MGTRRNSASGISAGDDAEVMYVSVEHSQLSIGEIHVWMARLGDDHPATAEFLRILSVEEQTRAAQFSFERDRVRFIQAHAILRQILANYMDADARTLTFAYNRHGKPYLLMRANDPELHFSVSHSHNCCIIAVALHHAIGIDIEKLRDLSSAIAIAQSYFTPAENRILGALDAAAQRDTFFALWVRKEATVKALGTSLAANLGRIEFDTGCDGLLRLVACNGDRAVSETWSILGLDPAPGYVAALASMHPVRSVRMQSWTNANH